MCSDPLWVRVNVSEWGSPTIYSLRTRGPSSVGLQLGMGVVSYISRKTRWQGALGELTVKQSGKSLIDWIKNKFLIDWDECKWLDINHFDLTEPWSSSFRVNNHPCFRQEKGEGCGFIQLSKFVHRNNTNTHHCWAGLFSLFPTTSISGVFPSARHCTWYQEDESECSLWQSWS